jgi:hypothetical protein
MWKVKVKRKGESKDAIESENERWKENWQWKMQGKVGKSRNGGGHKGWAVWHYWKGYKKEWKLRRKSRFESYVKVLQCEKIEKE